MSDAKLIKGREAKRGLRKVSDVAKECSQVLAGVNDLKEVESKIRDILKKQLGNDEAFVLVNPEGRWVIHTNRFREGLLFNDPASLRAIQSTQAFAQIFHRDTGEVLLDCCSPVMVNGKHLYSLRLALVLTQKRLLPAILAVTYTPIILGIACYFLLPNIEQAILWWAILGVLSATGMAIGLYVTIKGTLTRLYKGSRAIANGDLTFFNKTKANDEIGRFAFEFNKLSLGLKTVIKEVQESARSITKAGSEQAQATREVNQAADQIAASMQDVIEGAQEQNLSMQEAGEITGHMAETMNQMAENGVKAASLAEQALQATEKGNLAVNHAIEQMNNIRQSVEVSTKVIRDLEEKSNQIGDIINTITKIANQTNLLALNAAIEAARAGEQGRGFAVVAEEVRKLAEESSNSAQKIMAIITETQSKTTEAVKAMLAGAEQVQIGTEVINETGEAISQIREVVKETSEQTHTNSNLARNLSEGSSTLVRDLEKTRAISERTSSVIESVSASVQEQIAMSQEIAASSKSLSSTAEQLKLIVEKFHVE